MASLQRHDGSPAAHPSGERDSRSRSLPSALRAVEASIEAAVVTHPARVRDALLPIATGGQRLRARTVWFAAQTGATAPHPDRLVSMMTAVELLHLATLAHDDVIDGDLERRGHPSLYAALGEGPSIVAGDRLIASAFEHAAEASAGLVGQLATCLAALCDGQQHEELSLGSGTWGADDYWRAVDGKTASLFVLAAKAGGELARVDGATQMALGAYGTAYGRAYQLADDVVDLPTTPPERQLLRALLEAPTTRDERDGSARLAALAAQAAWLFGSARRYASLSTLRARGLVALAEAGRLRSEELEEGLRPVGARNATPEVEEGVATLSLVRGPALAVSAPG